MSKGSFTRAAAIMVFAIFLSRVLGLIRESVIAAKFGQQAITDVYKYAFEIPDILWFMIAGGALSSAFIPVFTQYLTQGKDSDAWKVYSVIGTVMSLVILPLILLMMALARVVMPYVAPGFTEWQLNETARLTRIVLPSQFFFFAGGLTMGTLYARKQFAVPALGPIIYNLCIIGGGLWLTDALGIAGLAWGALFGAFLGNFVVQIWYATRLGISFKFSLDTSHPGVRRVFMLMLPVILGLSLPQIDVIINKFFATFLFEGAVSAVDNANRLMQVPMGIFGQAAGIAALPALSALAAQEDWREFRDTVSFGVRSVFFAMIPAGIFMMVLAKPIVALVYQAGEFGPEDTSLASSALVAYSAGVFAWGGQAIIARGFYALQDTWTPIIIGTIMTIVFVPLNWVMMLWLGHKGLALATSIMAVAHLLGLSVFLSRRISGIGGSRIVASAIRIGVASLPAAAVSWGISFLLSRQIESTGTLAVKAAAGVQVLGGFIAFMIVYLAGCRVLRVEEAAAFVDMISRRLSRRRLTQKTEG